MTAEEFLERELGKPNSRLEPFAEDLRKLRAAGLSYQRMTVFLKENGVEVTSAGLSAYMRRHGLAEAEIPTSRRSKKPTAKTAAAKSAKTPEPSIGPVGARSASDYFQKKKIPEVGTDLFEEE